MTNQSTIDKLIEMHMNSLFELAIQKVESKLKMRILLNLC